MQTLLEKIRTNFSTFSKSERMIAKTVLDTYPAGSLERILDLADMAGTSSATVTRFVRRLGFAGYPEFQEAVRQELREVQPSPTELFEHYREHEIFADASDVLGSYCAAASSNLSEMTNLVSREDFAAIGALLANTQRRLVLVGGRWSDSIASLMAFHNLLQP